MDSCNCLSREVRFSDDLHSFRPSCVHRPPMSRFSEFQCSVGDWKLTKMAACNHFSFSKVCGDYFDGFSGSNQKECRKSCSSLF